MERMKLDLANIRVESMDAGGPREQTGPTEPNPSVVRWCSAAYTSCHDACPTA